MDTLLQDVRFALAILRRHPGFSAVAILTLALGIGANTAIFGVVDAVLLRSLPYRDAGSLVKVTFDVPGLGLRDVPSSVPEWEDLKSKADVFEGVSVTWPVSANLTGARQPVRLELLGVSPDYFAMLGAAPQLGRLFGPEDTARGFAEAAVISDGLWRREFGSDPAVLGRRVQLDNDAYTIVGVLPASFRHPGKTVAGDVDVWATAGFSADPFPKPVRSARLLPGLIGRLKEGRSVEGARARLATFAESLRREFPGDYPAAGRWTIQIEPLQEAVVGSSRALLVLLMGSVLMVVLIASANVANLLLARASERQREIGMRVALGASRARVVRQMLTESLVLSALGGAFGLLVASAGLSLGLRFLPSSIPRLQEVGLSANVLGFALVVSLLSGLAFGLVPAIQCTRRDLVSRLREGGQGTGSSPGTARLRSLLIVSELALAVMLAVGSGLLLRTLFGLLNENPGFDRRQLVVASVWLPVPNDPKTDVYADAKSRAAFLREVLRRTRGIPGVELAAVTSDLPGTPAFQTSALQIEDRPRDSREDVTARVIRVTPDYFSVLRSPIRRGRAFLESDEPGALDVAVVDETTASRYWAGADPIGRRLKLGQAANAPWFTVVGVIGDVKHDGLDKDGVPHVYVSDLQRPSRALSLVARTALPAASLESPIRRAIQAVDPALPVFKVRAMEDVLDGALAPRRFSAQVVGLFALVSLLLASLGIYGLLAYLVGQRSREIAIRVSVGARPEDVLRLILRRGALLGGAGVLAGTLLAAFAAPALAAFLYGVRPHDPLVFAVTPVTLLAVALVASYLPARRATRVDPVTALRQG
jgi:putative ABC transport system permease protein